MIALLVGLAAASGLGDLARTGEPAVVMRCQNLADFMAFGRVEADTSSVGATGPVEVVVLSRGASAPSELIWRAETDDPLALHEALAAIGFQSDIGEGVVGGHEPFQPFALGGDPTSLAVRALREDTGKGCAGAMMGSAVPSLPAALFDSVIAFAFTDWDEPMLGSIDLPSSPMVTAVLDGEGSGPEVVAHSVHQFDSAFQLHGTLRESAFALATVDEDAFVTALSVLGMLPRRLQVARGATVAFSRDKHWALALPLDRPPTAKKARRLLFRGLRRMDIPYTELHENHLRVSPLQGPPMLIGLSDGLVFASTRDDVVMDALAGVGEPWIEPASRRYGLRLRIVDMGLVDLHAEQGLYRFSFSADHSVRGTHE